MGENMKLMLLGEKMNKKAELEGLIKIIGWIVFFGIVLGALYFLIRRFTG